ncbi:MAG: Fe2+ or Zn2+ uptake regulation protein [Cognaticolwellia sp.]|jgi:Fe2+ or Zn2+ uptake regulation protein
MLNADHIDALLGERGLVLTQQRRRIVAHLDGNLSHPTAAQIYASVAPGVTLSTVYNTLALLKDLGVVSELPQHGGESRFDPNAAPHHHLLCSSCGALHDVPAEQVQVTLLADARIGGQGSPDSGIAAAGIEQVQVSFLGRCPGGCPGH